MSTSSPVYDVAIMGGGLAGLSLGLQLLRERPSATVLVVEKRSGPAPEGAFKVGESAVELASWYFAETLGLRDHLERDQLPKFGLRYFLSAGDNRDVARRCEFGPLRLHAEDESRPLHRLPVPAYNLDRGRLENVLSERCRDAGVTLRTGVRITGVDVGNAGRHTLEWTGESGVETANARWLVDASGRAGILKRKLGLAQSTEHRVDAVWFRLGVPIDPEDWSADAEWRARTTPGLRRLSTIHFMGRGYWVWLIPLASGGTSVGIVLDAEMHDVADINRFDKALAWLQVREPQCASAVENGRATLQDFHLMKGGAYGCKRLFSLERWAITGDAGVFLDPLYSPGSDFIAVGNTLIADLICKDLAGKKIRASVNFAETLYQSMFQQYLLLYREQYAVMGRPQVMVAKIVWDTALYFGYNLLLFRNQRFCDRKFFILAREQIKDIVRLQGMVQAALKRWAKRDESSGTDRFVDQATIGFLWELYVCSKGSYDDGALHRRLGRNLDILEAYAREIVRRAAGEVDKVDEQVDDDRSSGWQPSGRELRPEPPASMAPGPAAPTDTPRINLAADLQRLWIP